MSGPAKLFFGSALMFLLLLVGQVIAVSFFPQRYVSLVDTIPVKSLVLCMICISSFCICALMIWYFHLPSVGRNIIGWQRVCGIVCFGGASANMGIFTIERLVVTLDEKSAIDLSFADAVGPSAALVVAGLILGVLLSFVHMRARQWEMLNGLGYHGHDTGS